MTPERLAEIEHEINYGDLWGFEASKLGLELIVEVHALQRLCGADLTAELLATAHLLHRAAEVCRRAAVLGEGAVDVMVECRERAGVLEQLAERLREAAKGAGQDGTP